VGAQKARLAQITAEWNRQHEAQVKRVENALAALHQARAHEIRIQRMKRAEVERIKRLPAQAVMDMSDEDLKRALDVEGIRKARTNFDVKCRVPAAPMTIHPAISIMQQLDAPTLLPSLTPELKHQLQQFLGAVKLDVSRTGHDRMLNDHRTAQDDRHGVLTILMSHAIIVCM
jgi:hypothetical protein